MNTWESKEILNIYNNIIKDCKILNNKDLENKYLLFKEANPKLYDMAIFSVVNNQVQEQYEILTKMLNARENMINGKVSKLNTDFIVGNQLGKKYIYPKTNTPSQKDYTNAIKQITEKINSPKE